MARPFRVERSRGRGYWRLYMTTGPGPRRLVGDFRTAGDAVDHAYRNWPWWP